MELNFNVAKTAFLFCALTSCLIVDNVSGELMDMKIVEEPSTFGAGYSSLQQANSQPALKLRVQPANFSGPPHLKRLLGRCYSDVILGYKYNFCPFSNVTQHEQGIHWNPFNGVLGVWQQWTVEDNTFTAMLMQDGESCGQIFRSVKVTFECGNTSKILNVTEPETCHYHMRFQSPLVCHPDSMLVYPTLPRNLQHEWDAIEGEMTRQELTEKGYRIRLDRVFEKAGIYLTRERHSQLVQKAEEVKQEKMKDGEFDSLESCKAGFKRLQEEIKLLTGQLGMGSEHGSKVQDSTH